MPEEEKPTLWQEQQCGFRESCRPAAHCTWTISSKLIYNNYQICQYRLYLRSVYQTLTQLTIGNAI